MPTTIGKESRGLFQPHSPFIPTSPTFQPLRPFPPGAHRGQPTSQPPLRPRGGIPGLGHPAGPQVPGTPAGFLPRAHKVGASPDFPTPHAPGLDANIERLKELVQSLQERDDPDPAEKGTLKSIGRTEERYDYIAGACGYYHRPLFRSLFGKDRFKGMRQLQDHSHPTLRELKINVIFTNRLCYGVSAVQFGGENCKGYAETLFWRCGLPAVFGRSF